MNVEDYRFGKITIDGKTYTSDVIIMPERVQAPWWRTEGHSLCPEDIGKSLDQRPDVLVIGTGADGAMKVPASTMDFIRERCQTLHVARTAEACERFNELSAQGARVVAALHLTC